MNVYRVWFDSGNDRYGVCCVLVSAMTEERAVELAKNHVKCFHELENAPFIVNIFDTNKENVSVC